MASGPYRLVLVACDVLAAEADTVAKSKSAPRSARLRSHGQLTPVDRGDALVTVSVGPHNEAIAMWSTASGRRTLSAMSRCQTEDGYGSMGTRSSSSRFTGRLPVDAAVGRRPSAVHIMISPLVGSMSQRYSYAL